MWRRVAWLVVLPLLVNGAASLSLALAQTDDAGKAACDAVEQAAAEGSEQLTQLVGSDPARFIPALSRLLAMGVPRPEYAALLAAQGENAFSELLPLLADSDEDSRLFLVARKWQSPVFAKLLEQRESPHAKHRKGAERAVMWLAADRARGVEMFRLLQEKAPRQAIELEGRLSPLDWGKSSAPTIFGEAEVASATADEINSLIGWISSPRPHVARWAINSLSALGPDASAASAPLQAWLEPRLADWNGVTTRSAEWYHRAVLPGVHRPRPIGPVNANGQSSGPLFVVAEGDLVHDALLALHRIDPNAPSVRSLIRRGVRQLRDPQLVDQWLAWLGAVKDSDSVDLLIEELQYPDPVLRQTAAVALGRMGKVAAPAAKSLRAAIDASRAGSHAFRLKSHQSRWLLLDDPEKPEPTSDAEKLAAIAFCRRDLFLPDEELVFRQAAEAALQAIAGQAVDFDHWPELGPQKFKGSAHFFPVTAPPEASERQLSHWSVETRRRAVNALAYRTDPPRNLVELLVGQLNAPVIEVDAFYRFALVEAVGRQPNAQLALPTLLAIAGSSREAVKVRIAAARAAARIGPNDPQVVDGLVSVLSDRQKEDSSEAYDVVAGLLGEMPAARGKAEAALQRLSDEGSERARQVAVLALGKLSALTLPSNPSAFAERLQSWQRLSSAERIGVAERLYDFVSQARTAAGFDHADTQPLSRTSELAALLPLLLAAYQQSTDKDERYWLLNVIHRIGPDSSKVFVQTILDAEAYSMLQSLYVSDRSTLALIMDRRTKFAAQAEVYRPEESWLLFGIARYGADARSVALEVLPELDAMQLGDTNSIGLFRARLEVVVSVGPETPGVYETLLRLLGAAWPATRREDQGLILAGLGRLGPPTEGDDVRARVVKVLGEHLEREDEQIVRATVDTIQAMASQLADGERRALVVRLAPLLSREAVVLDRARDRAWRPVLISAIRVLGAFGASASDAVPVLQQKVAEWNPDPRKRHAYSSGQREIAREASLALEKIRAASAASK